MGAFRGWYFKCQDGARTLAVIPARHASGRERSSSVQLITDGGAWNFRFPYEQYREVRRGFGVRVGANVFDAGGLRIDLKNETCSARGEVRFGPLSPIRYDIMGPFRYVPFMECRHSVISMAHTVAGEILVNGERLRFNGAGYIEGDRGRSFPREYLWTQCHFDGGSLMLSAADIPLCGRRFTGIIGVILYRGREFRLATYLGARALEIGGGAITVRQGDKRFTARLIGGNPRPLRAPASGAMARTIRESASCAARYRFEIAGEPLFDFTAQYASFEYEFSS